MFVGFGTVVNVAAVLVGSGLGLALGHRFPQRTRDTVTDALGLVTLLIGGLAVVEVTSAEFAKAVGSNAPVLIILGSLLIGGILGSLVNIESRLEGFGGWLRERFSSPKGIGAARSVVSTGSTGISTDVPGISTDGPGISTDGPGTSIDSGFDSTDVDAVIVAEAAVHRAKERFIEGFVSASLVFCVGPLTVLGSLSDGLGLGADQLILKATLDGFAAIAFAASLGIGVMASAIAIAVIQGLLTLVGFLLGDFLPAAQLASVTAAGGLLLIGVGLRLLRIKMMPVGNLLPALVVAPLLVQFAVWLR